MNIEDRSVADLTDRQCEVLELVLRHFSSKEIAVRLGISPSAVDQRLDGARQKLGAATRTEAARIYADLRDLDGACERLPYEPFGVPDPDAPGQQELDDRSEPLFRLSDAGGLPPAASNEPWWENIVPELRSERLGTGKRLLLIVWGAVGLVILLGLFVALIMGLNVLI